MAEFNKEAKEMTEDDINEMMNYIIELETAKDNLEMQIANLQHQLENSNNKGQRKAQVLELLRKHQTISILEIANKLQITTKNVSSQLTYLRSDGYQIFTDPNGKKMLVEKEQESSEE